MLFIIILQLLALSLVAAQAEVSRGNAFIGCANSPGPSYSSRTLGVFGTSGGCASRCASERPNEIIYSAYQRSTKLCLCLASSQSASPITASSSNAGSGTCNNAADYSFYRIYTSYTFDRCYSTPDFGFTIRVEDIGNCFNFCRKSDILQVRASASDNLYICGCYSATSAQPQTTSECGSSGNTVYRYNHPFAAASAGVARKRREMRNSNKMSKDYCPAGLKACKVPGVADQHAFECLDVMSELESCGGCVAGEYGVEESLDSQVQGINCMLGDTSEFSSITCKVGKCVDEQK